MPNFPGPKRSTRNSPEIDFETRKALDDIELRLADLESKRPVEKETIIETSPVPGEDLEVPSDLRVGNDFRIEGSVDAPHLYEGLIKVVPAGTLDTTAQRVINMAGSLVIAPGSLSADSLRGRVLDIDDPATVYAPTPLYVADWDDFTHSGPATADASDNGTIGKLNWNFFTSNDGAIEAWTGALNHPGAVYWTPGSVAGDVSTLYQNVQDYPFLNGIEWGRWTTVIRSTSVAANNLDVRIGLMDNITFGVISDAIMFVHDEDVYGDNNWRFWTEAGGSNTTTDTGSAIGVAQWTNLQIEYWRSHPSTGAARVKAYINGAEVADHTTNILATDTQVLQWTYVTKHNDGNSNIVVDYYSQEIKVAR